MPATAMPETTPPPTRIAELAAALGIDQGTAEFITLEAAVSLDEQSVDRVRDELAATVDRHPATGQAVA